jgi:predicted nucleotidyltransferase
MTNVAFGLWQTAIELQRYLESIDRRFCIIGGIAVQRWGKPRTTRDVDATVFVEFGKEKFLAKEILKRYQSRVSDPITFALQARILLLQDIAGNNIDLSFGGMSYEDRLLERSSNWMVAGHGEIQTCSAEDLIVLKAFAARPQDWIDVKNIIVRQGGKLDIELVRKELTPLAELKESPEIIDQLESLIPTN